MRRITFNGKELRMVVFDFDGVLYDGDSHSVEVAEKLGIGEMVKKNLRDLREGRISFEEAIINSAAQWKGVGVEETLKLMRELKLEPERRKPFKNSEKRDT